MLQNPLFMRWLRWIVTLSMRCYSFQRMIIQHIIISTHECSSYLSHKRHLSLSSDLIGVIVSIQDIGLPRSSVSMVTANTIPLFTLFFKEDIGLASPISMETRERPTSNSDLVWPKETRQTLVNYMHTNWINVVSYTNILCIKICVIRCNRRQDLIVTDIEKKAK